MTLEPTFYPHEYRMTGHRDSLPVSDPGQMIDRFVKLRTGDGLVHMLVVEVLPVDLLSGAVTLILMQPVGPNNPPAEQVFA